MKTTQIILALIIAIVLSACGSKIDKAKLLGGWRLETAGSDVVGILNINPDGNFRREFQNSVLTPVRGQWTLSGKTLKFGDSANEVYTVALADGATLVLVHHGDGSTETWRR